MNTALPDGEAMSDADIVRVQLTKLELSQREAARRLGIDERTFRYYCAGKERVPTAVILALRHLIQIQENNKCLALLADGTMAASDGIQSVERLREANATLRAANQILVRRLMDAASDV